MRKPWKILAPDCGCGCGGTCATVADSYISAKERDDMDPEDFAGPHQSFPIRNQQDVDDAARLVGHADDPDAVKSKVVAIAHRLGLTIPEAWQDSSKRKFKCATCGSVFAGSSPFCEACQSSENVNPVDEKEAETVGPAGVNDNPMNSEPSPPGEKTPRNDEIKNNHDEDWATIGDSVAIVDAVASKPKWEDVNRNGVLMRVRQWVTKCDFRNKNDRIYKRHVVQDAINRARERARVGVMLSEREHPAVMRACDSSGCGDKFADNFEHKTARIVSISDVQADGRVYVVREILDTPMGRLVAKAIRDGSNKMSVRWMMYGADQENGAIVPRKLDFVTVDDVETPATEGAGELVAASDSAKVFENYDPEPESEEGLGDPFQGESNNTVNPHTTEPESKEVATIANGDSPNIECALDAQGTKKPMTIEEIRRKFRAFTSALKSSAPITDVKTKERDFADALIDSYREGVDVAEFVHGYKSVMDSLAPGAAYHSGVSGPYVELGNELGGDPLIGWGEDIRCTEEKKNGKGEGRMISQKSDPKLHSLDKPELKADGEEGGKYERSPEELAKDRDRKKVEAKVDAAIDQMIADGHPVGKLPDDMRDMVRKSVKQDATDDDGGMGDSTRIATLVDSAVEQVSKMLSDSSLLSRGNIARTPVGSGVDPASPIVSTGSQARPGEAGYQKLLAATDEWLRNMAPSNTTLPNPDNPDIKAMRDFNRAKIAPLFDAYLDRMAQRSGNPGAFWGSALGDSADPMASLQTQFERIAGMDSYTTAVSSLPNQPTIMKWLLVQAFQDMRMTQFVQPIGPGQEAGPGLSGWETQQGLGRVFKVPYESYVDPTGWGQEYGSMDFGLLTPENQGITEGSIALYWDTFFPQWRKNATSATIEGIKSIGNGPLNLAAAARNLWHATARKSRTIDLALANEIPDIAMEYGAVAVSAEAYTTANHGLPNNSAFPGSGTITVNLNPAKTASAAVVAGTDAFVQYPNPNVVAGAGGAAPIAAIRLLSGVAVGNNAAPYMGTNTYTWNPTVRPRTQMTLTSAGADSTSTLNPVTVTAPAAAVAGLLGPDGYIYSYPGTTATYAMDYANGVIVFASGVTGAGGVVTTSTTVAYSYATNFDIFPITPGINGMQNLATGETPVQFYARLIAQFDQTAGKMASWPRFVAPDLALMSTTLSPYITEATTFYKLNSPKGTELFPTEDFFATRNGINMARLNTPWWVGDSMIVLTRRDSTKYAIDTPWEVRGPAIKYDSNGNFIAGEGYMGWESSCICTPQVKNGSGTVINPVARGILCVK